MTDTKTIQESVDNWLQAHGVKAEIQKIGDACPMFCEDKGKPGIGTFPRTTHIHGQHYRLTLSRLIKGHTKYTDIVIEFWNSYNDAMILNRGLKQGFNKTMPCSPSERSAAKVTAADILYCAEFNDPGMFEDFASEFGYDSDSRKAEKVYQAVREQYQDMCMMFSESEREELAELVREM